jgi:hypothetical protein
MSRVIVLVFIFPIGIVVFHFGILEGEQQAIEVFFFIKTEKGNAFDDLALTESTLVRGE